VCGERTITASQLYWCDHCNIPLFEDDCLLCGRKGKYLTTDIRPVFPEERLLLEILLGKPFAFKESSVWNGTGNRYYVDGEKISFAINNLKKYNADLIKQQYDDLKDINTYDFFNDNIEKFIKANSKRFDDICAEADSYITESVKGFFGKDDVSEKELITQIFVSFSGGKDSTVTSDLVTKALSRSNVVHLFGNTTLEFPETLEYIKRLKSNYPNRPILVAENKEQSFNDICDIVGPPSRIMRWCCTVFKTGAISKKITSTYKNESKILTFYGIRRSESKSRKGYDRESSSPKISKQKVVSPIIDWFDFDIWLYILSTKIDFNYAYRLGFARVGCWCCPNNSSWSEFLSSIHMSEQYKTFNKQLVEFAKQIGKPDPEVYVAEGGWKARQGGNNIEYSKNTVISFKPCATEENTFDYELQRPITDELYELFKPFGKIVKGMGNARLGEIFIEDRDGKIILKLQGRVGTNRLKVSILDLPLAKTKTIKDAELKIKCQLTKYQVCMGCHACEGVCRFNAISMKKSNADSNTYYYHIDDNKCKRCYECINHFDGGCYIRKVLATKRGENN
jgi:phosphoadenosine phosphosulfate reductase